MDIETIKPFINHDVEVLVGGVWIEGHMAPIVKGVIVLHPLQEMLPFYGPTALKADVIQAIRQVKKNGQPGKPFTEVPVTFHDPSDHTIVSGLNPIPPRQRFAKK